MCVSAEASFGLSALLAPVGTYCVRQAIQQDRALVPLATIPLLFGVQQAFEGLVWLGIDRNDAQLVRWAALAYLFFAFAFWLFWIPFSAAFLEQRRTVKRVLALMSVLGMVGGAVFYLPVLLNPDSLAVMVYRHSIRYEVLESYALDVIPQTVWQLAYLAVVGMPFLIVTRQRKGLIGFGAGIVVSAAISHAFFWYAFPSVWCFFAAALSILLAFLFQQLALTTEDFHQPSSAHL